MTPESSGEGGGFIDAARVAIIKIGSALLVDRHRSTLRESWLDGLAADVGEMRERGQQVLLVSSGAIALGRALLGYGGKQLSLEQSQAAAAAGQIHLAQAYAAVLGRHGMVASQVLLTLGDTQDRRRYLNAGGTLRALLSVGSVPIINENDTVATDEIRYGDNDRLAARTALMVGADLLILLTDVDGLYTADPRTDRAAELVPEVGEITQAMLEASQRVGSPVSRGGMHTKLLAAQTAMQGGCLTAVARGDGPRPVQALRRGGTRTLFHPTATPQAARKQWIAGLKTTGTVVIDAGAAGAIRAGKSLLPVGVVAVESEFARGDAVALRCEGEGTIGAGLIAYNAGDAARIAGQPTRAVREILGHPGRSALVHRDDMVLWERT